MALGVISEAPDVIAETYYEMVNSHDCKGVS